MTILASRWFLIGPFVLAGIILAIWYGVWRAGGAYMRAEIEKFAAMEAARGARVDRQPLQLEGFPFFLRGRLDDVSYEKDGLRLETDRLYIDALPYALDRLVFSLGGEQRFITDVAHYRLVPDNARASIERDKARGWLLRIQAEALQLSVETITGASALTGVETGPLLLNLGPEANNPFTLETSLVIDRLSFEGRRPDATPIRFAADRLEGFAALSAADAVSDPAKWRALGGQLDLKGLALASSDSALRVSGAVSLDAAGYPAGRLDAKIDRPEGLAIALLDAGLLSERDAETLGNGLKLAAMAGGGSIGAPIDLRGGHARLLGFRLAPLPAVISEPE